ncbi:hypothetical protein SmJEL517_g06183 [Synchytrium microbalum]|uniref:Uncharacterized protein n=1 Tax=Synchytrium microbalum TaxID=1806994 RepID=A0A507BWJ2_9FUNG|nr:uncharacterized protein SmJEL517_g06183 [Synchytrium microbalum]TPX30204.1 hypothetical protein SmJEL517_g06183 [Synchytrium microbalum]
MEAEPEVTWIGLSLGSAYSTISVLNKDGRVEVIANADGERQIASCVTFTDFEQLAGTQAKQRGSVNPKNMAVRFLDLLGRKMDDDHVSYITKSIQVPISPKTENANTPVFEITTEPKWDEPPVTVQYTAIDITTRYVTHLISTAQEFLGKKIDGCVISCPVNMTPEGRLSLKLAAEKANAGKVMLVKEPAAAALAFYHYPTLLATGALPPPPSANKPDQNIVVVDFGAHHLSTTVMSSSKDLFSIIASNTTNVGGSHIDKLLASHFAIEFQRKTRMDVTESRKSMIKLQSSVESAKRLLSKIETASCHVDSLHEGVDFTGSIHRGRLEMMIEEPLTMCLASIKQTLDDAKMTAEQVDQVLLVGGSSRIPRFQAMIKSLFKSSDIRTDIESDEAISLGCAIQALIVANSNAINYIDLANDATLYANVPHVTKSIGIEVAGSVFATIIPKRAPIPVRKSLEFGLNQDSNTNSKAKEQPQRDIYLAVYEGEEKIAKQNTLIAEIVVSDLGGGGDDVPDTGAPATNGKDGKKEEPLRVEVIFTIEKDLVLRVSVLELNGPRKGHVTKHRMAVK